MSLPRTVADVIASHVTLELESLDRVYLNVYQPKLQTPCAVFHFLRENFGAGAVSSHQMKAITEQFLESIEDYVLEHEIPVISFEKGQRKEDVAASTWLSSLAPRESSSSARPRRRFAPSGLRDAAMSEVKPIPGSSIPPQWSTNTTSMPSTQTSDPSSSSTVRTFPTVPSFASTAMNISNGSSPRRASAMRNWPTES